MKKTLSLAEQVRAAREEVESWPESVRSATELRHSDFFHDIEDESVAKCVHRREGQRDDEFVLKT